MTYREWAPAAVAAALVGDFPGGSGAGVPLARDKYGVWEAVLPDAPDGTPAVPHQARVRVRLRHPGGWDVECVPAWAACARPEPGGAMDARYDGVHWDPPTPYAWRHARPPRPAAPRVYEAHVGMSSAAPAVASYAHFAAEVVPRVAAAGYTHIQLMAVQEHSYYASFGYHVTSPFAVSSRCGTPDDLKALVDAAHGAGLGVLLDVVHSHVSSNPADGLAGYDFEPAPDGGTPWPPDADTSYFCAGARGRHPEWGSRLLNYRNWEVLRYLLSNVAWWLTEYRFDGFRFDGVTSMLYWHHGVGVSFLGNCSEYFSPATNVDACVYLMLANELAHALLPGAVTVAEDVSGMPTLCRPVAGGGLGFDYRLAMGVPDLWARLGGASDDAWRAPDVVAALTNRRRGEAAIAYVESHDQAMVGGATLAWRLMGTEMYDGMSALRPPSPTVARGCALHKVARLMTFVLGGQGYLTFMGNEFGHPEWIDFPRHGNDWSHAYARRQWALSDAHDLRYAQLAAWDKAVMDLDATWGVLASAEPEVARAVGSVAVAVRAGLVCVFNLGPEALEGEAVGVPGPGTYAAVLDSEAPAFGGGGGGGGGAAVEVAAHAAPADGLAHSVLICLPARSAVVFRRIRE